MCTHACMYAFMHACLDVLSMSPNTGFHYYLDVRDYYKAQLPLCSVLLLQLDRRKSLNTSSRCKAR